MDLDRMLEMIKALGDERVDYLVIGGVAMNLHGIARGTEDIDIFVRAVPENLERLRTALRRVWDDPEIDAIRTDDLIGEFAVVRYGPPDEDFVIDVMTRLGEAFSFEDLTAETIEIEGVRVRVATPETLLKMKRDTMRPIDRSDAEALRQVFDLKDDR